MSIWIVEYRRGREWGVVNRVFHARSHARAFRDSLKYEQAHTEFRIRRYYREEA